MPSQIPLQIFQCEISWKKRYPYLGHAIIEMALMADGVAAKDVYKVMDSSGGIDPLCKTRYNHDHVFLVTGAKPLELVSSGEVSMALAYNGRER